MVNVAAVPDRLKDRVIKPEDQDVLYRLFAEIMIDAINLVFAEHCFDLAVQRLRRIEIIAERFLDDDSPPATVFLVR